MKPLSFYEYLAERHLSLLEFVKNQKIEDKVENIFHDKLLEYVREYFLVGGMPKAARSYIETGSMLDVFAVQDRINYNYRNDFAKYSRKVDHQYLEKLYSAAPKYVGEKFKYSKIDPESDSRGVKRALDLLVSAGILHKIKRSSGAGLPLEAGASDKHFKTAFIDIGLVQRSLGMSDDFHSLIEGALAEQFVAQELLTVTAVTQEPNLYYWARESKNSAAEIDYLFAHKGSVVPIEVKAGKTGRLKSMRVFMQQYKTPIGVRISSRPLEFSHGILTVPFYMIPELPRLLVSL
jgi:predicted AAA+ superfamily ATPase